MGQTKWCWSSGPAAWMYHKGLPISSFFTLLPNKLSLDRFDSVPRLSCSLGLKCRDGWQVVAMCMSLAQPGELGFFPIRVVFFCLPIPPSSSLHTLFYVPAFFLPRLLLYLFLPPSSVLISAPFTSTNPKTACTLVLLLSRCPHPSSAQAETPVATSVAVLGVCVALLKLCSPQPISPLMYLLFQNFLCSFSLLAAAHPLQHSGARPGCSIADSRLMSDLLWS